MARTLAHFTIGRNGEDYLLQIEDEDGETIEIAATFEQLDLIVETIDTHLNEDEEVALGTEADTDVVADENADDRED